MNDNFQVEEYRTYLLVLARMQLQTAGPVKNRLEASDLVQEALLKAHDKRDQFRGTTPEAFRKWLRQVLANVLVDAQRHHGAQRRDAALEKATYETLSTYSVRLEELLAADQESPSQYVARRERALLVTEALNALPADRRIAVELHHLGGYSIREVAETMDKTTASVAGLLRRGLDELRKTLEPVR